jgi:hypothetical protein
MIGSTTYPKKRGGKDCTAGGCGRSFCLEKEISPGDIKDARNPPIIVTQFIWYMNEKGIKPYRVKEAHTAVHAQGEIIQVGMAKTIGETMMVRTALANSTGGTRKGSKYRQIWDLRILVTHIREGPEPHTLAIRDLMARTAALFMILLSCRPIGMLRIDPRTEKWDKDKNG